MERDGIIAKVNGPTDWVHNVVVEKKNGALRMCLDPKGSPSSDQAGAFSDSHV